MKILLSPAKLMSLETEGQWKKSTTPKFLNGSEEIMQELINLQPKDLQKLMGISKELAEMNAERYLNWKPKPTKKKSLQAVLAFKGEVYRGLDAESLSEEAQDYLNQNLFILSGLYGILRPSDRVMLYRLEMGSQLNVRENKNLYGFWKGTLTDFVNSKTKSKEILLNLASNEYAKALDDKKLKAQKIEVEFLDYKNGKLKPIMVFFKQARGAMARYCAENNVQNLEEVKCFNENNYTFDAQLSTNNKLVFVR